MQLNLFDFDNTIYAGDSSTDFFFYSMMKYPRIVFLLPKIVLASIKYKCKIISKTEMKEIIFSFLKYIPNIDALVLEFWDSHESYIKDFYVQRNHDKDIIISASPEFLLKPIAKKLEVYDLIGSVVDKKTGMFKRPNCHGIEKVKRLSAKHKNYKIMEAYSDSKSDIPILKLAKNQFMIKGKRIRSVKF